jgi:hypothetical protein
MNISNLKRLLMGCLASICVMLTACTSEQDPKEQTGKGSIHLGLTTSTVFTKAVTESDYGDVNKYTVQILNDQGTAAVEDFIYGEAPERITLNNGNYTLKAFYGEEKSASRDGFYVAGEQRFSVDGEEVQVEVACKPRCGKVVVHFADEMSTYFSNYSVIYETEALKSEGTTAIWQKDDTEPWYLKVNEQGESVKATISFTRLSDNVADSKEKTYTLTPGKSWTLNIAPQDNNGSLDITVTIDESTDDEEIDIEVPSERV